MKSLFTGLFIFFCFSITAQNSQSVFFEITGNGLHQPSYVYGTIDASDPRTFKGGDSVFIALASTSTLAIDDQWDTAKIDLIEDLLTLPDDRLLIDYVNNSEFYLVDKQFYLRKDNSLWDYDHFYPLYLRGILENAAPANSRHRNMEEFVTLLAKEQGKNIQGLFTTEEKINNVMDIPVKVQADILVNYAQYLNAPRLEHQRIQLYLNGQLKELLGFYQSNFHFEYFEGVNRKKAKAIGEKMPAMMKESPTLFLLDASYLTGDNGVLKVLKAKGYNLKPIKTGFENGLKNNVDMMKSDTMVFMELDSLFYLDLNAQYRDEYFENTIPGWYLLTSHQGALSARMPERPEIVHQQIPTEEGVLDVHIYKTEDKALNEFHLISYNNYPPSFDPNQREGFFSEVIAGVVKRIGGSLLIERNISTDQFQGREIEIAVSENYTVRARFYLRNKRLYQIMVGGSDNRPYSDVNEAFLHSFRLIDQYRTRWFNINWGNFSLAMPKVPQRHSTVEPVKDDSIINIFYQVNQQSSGVDYLMKISYYPSSFQVKNLDQFYNSLLFKAANKVNGVVIEDEIRKFNSTEGRYVSLGSSNDKVYKLLLLYHEGVLYQMLLSGSEDSAYSGYADRFFDSFRVSRLFY